MFHNHGVNNTFLIDLEPLTIIQNQYTSTSTNIPPLTSPRSFGRRNSTYILLIISLLFLIRELFSAATMRNWSKENQESLWFPFEALPEFLAVCLYAIPDLVPSVKEMREGKAQLKLNIEIRKEDDKDPSVNHIAEGRRNSAPACGSELVEKSADVEIDMGEYQS